MRESLLKGNLEFPGKAILEKYPDQKQDIVRFWKVLWFNYLNDNDTNGIHWYSILGIKLYNDLVRRLSHHDWVTSHSLTGRKWVSIELNDSKLLEAISPDELQAIKAKFKYAKYTLGFEESTKSDVVKQNGKLKQTGLIRDGFMDVGNTQFGYDMTTLNKYAKAVKLNLTKSMDKIRHLYPEMKSSTSSYDEVSTGIFDYHLQNEHEVFTTGNNVNDSRGRAISSCLSKVFNPIGCKDARASLVITYE
jgi:hypothetical protein